MRYLILLCLLLVLSGCYLGNGPPGEEDYWIKNGNKITNDEINKCDKLADKYAFGSKKEKEKYDYLQSVVDTDPDKLIANKEDFNQYDRLLDILTKYKHGCYYSLGYRFNAPFYWCLIGNMHICKENIKYSGYGLNYIFPSSPSPQENTDSQ